MLEIGIVGGFLARLCRATFHHFNIPFFQRRPEANLKNGKNAASFIAPVRKMSQECVREAHEINKLSG
jgi:hypothetical protein